MVEGFKAQVSRRNKNARDLLTLSRDLDHLASAEAGTLINNCNDLAKTLAALRTKVEANV